MARSDTEHFCLRWNNFHSNLTVGFHALLQQVELVDVTLAAEGQFIQAHKIVLSVCSPYFKQLFQVNPCKHPIVILKDVGHKELVAILQFMYKGEVNVRQEELADFLKTAELLQVKGLTANDNNQETEGTACTPPQPPTQQETNSQICVTDVRSEAHMSEVSQRFPSGNEANTELTSPVSEDAVSPARTKKRLHSDSPVTSSNLTHTDEQTMAEFTPITPKIEPMDSDMVSEMKSTQIDAETLPHFLIGHSGESSQSHHEVSLGGCTSVTQTVTQSQSVRLPSFSQHRRMAERSLVPLQDTSQGIPRYVESSRGKKKLVYGGYVYHLHSDFGSKKYWRCTEYRKGCFGRCTMHDNRITSRNIAHNHGYQTEFLPWECKPFNLHVDQTQFLQLDCKPLDVQGYP